MVSGLAAPSPYNMLSRLMLVTERRLMKPTFEESLQAALEGGARLIQLREKDLSAQDLQSLAETSQRWCETFGASLIINSEAKIALNVGANGVHWPERTASIEYSKTLLNGVSVHSVEAAQRAQKSGANYLVFGSIFPTSSHPNETAKGLGALRAVVRAVSLPVYAIGGIGTKSTIRACLEAGAHGVAIRSSVWEAPTQTEKREKVALFLQWLAD